MGPTRADQPAVEDGGEAPGLSGEQPRPRHHGQRQEPWGQGEGVVQEPSGQPQPDVEH